MDVCRDAPPRTGDAWGEARPLSRIITRLAVVSILVSSLPAAASEWQIVGSESVLAIVTHKAGLAAGLAHDHVIVADEYEATLEFDPDSPTETRFEIRAKTATLEVDSSDARQRLFPRLREIGVVSEPFGDISEKDRAKVRATMLGPEQLDADRFPDILGSILAVRRSDDDARFPYDVRIAFSLHGKSVERILRGRVDDEGATAVFEAVGEFRFTDFGIEPYSAFLGTVKNRDGFDLYVRLVAIRPEE